MGPLSVEELPISWFLSIYEEACRQRRNPEAIVLVKISGFLRGYLCFHTDAEVISQAIGLPVYRQNVLEHKKLVSYCLLPKEKVELGLTALDETNGHGIFFCDYSCDDGFSSLEVAPVTQQLSLF